MSIFGRLFRRDAMEDYLRGIILFNRERYDEAIGAFERSLRAVRDPSDPYAQLGAFYAAEAHAKIGLACERRGDRERAEIEYRSALEGGYRYPDLHVRLAVLAEGRNDPAEAESEYRRALEIRPSYPEARCRLAILLAAEGRLAEASAEIAPLAAAGGWIPSERARGAIDVDAALIAHLRGMLAEREHLRRSLDQLLDGHADSDRDSAIAELESAVAAHPRYADLRCRLGTLWIEAGRVDEGMRELVRALEINPNYVEARLQAGLACLRLGKPDDAIAHLRVALEREPRYPDVHLFLGLASLRNGDLDDASEVFEGALSAMPGFNRALYGLGLVRLAQGRGSEAVALLEEAARLDPALRRVQLDLAFLRVRHGEPAIAAALFRQVLARDPADAEAHLGLGEALDAMGDWNAARIELLEAERRGLGGRNLAQALAKIEIRLGRAEDALPRIEQALEAEGEDADLLTLRGDALTRLGNSAKAKESYEAAVRRQPGRVEAHLGLGLSLFRLQDREAARIEMEWVLRADPGNPIARAFADEGLITDL